MKAHSNGRLMVAAFAGALVLAGCAHMMGKRPAAEEKAPMVRSVQPAQQGQQPQASPAKAKPRPATPTKSTATTSTKAR